MILKWLVNVKKKRNKIAKIKEVNPPKRTEKAH